MSEKEKLVQMIREQQGVITTKMVTAQGFSRRVLSELEEEQLISRVERGIYVMDSGCVDQYFLLQYRFPQGVFSHETALYLLGYLDQAPQQIQMTFPLGFNTFRTKEAKVQAIIASKDVTIGSISLQRSGGTTLQVYEIERTLIDLLKPRYKADKVLLMSALKQYIRSDACNIAKLNDYAQLFKLETKVQPYLEVLL
mgnify:CR=1 FL=1